MIKSLYDARHKAKLNNERILFFDEAVSEKIASIRRNL